MNISKVVGDIIRCLPHPFCNMVQEKNYKKEIDDLRSKMAKGGGKKVFGIGLSRTGTTSLNDALKILGYNSKHFNSGSRICTWPELFLLDATVDTPVSARFESLYYTFPNSKFVYTVRDVSEWIDSMEDFYGVKDPSKLGDEWEKEKFWGTESLKKPGWSLRNGVQLSMIQKSLYANHKNWRNAYQEFDRRVKHFFSDKEENVMLELNIANGEGWEKLCPFLGCEIPNQSFPHTNRQESASPWGS
jgi:hypothetical protein